MTDDDATPERPSSLPAQAGQPRIAHKNRLRLSLVWLVPIAAVIVGVVLTARTLLASGPEITIEFRTAEGIEPGRTEGSWRQVDVTAPVVHHLDAAADRCSERLER